ncbi:lipopolysaccharide biosynthesis protein [Sphaerisporangium corydalis]|uniref:Lipopolysaccharide biosynthesis protein n=1 Tax=Sphaerisporangium corydalis TaxID=1441875 RepID=A0ABV9EMD3_9ACTN|nr:polysaccharide biosynthesis C-terminal domain-containing protein [Sphaerisporangium corydalis]
MNPPLERALRMMASRVVRLVLAMITGLLIAHNLHPEGRGGYAVVTTIAYAAMVVGHLSVEQTQISLWAGEATRHALTVNALILGAVLGTLTAAAGIALAYAGILPAPPQLACLALLGVPFGVVTVNLTGLALLRSGTRVVGRASVASGLTQCLPAVALALAGAMTLSRAVACWTVSMIVPCLVFLRALRPWPLRDADLCLAVRQLALGGRYHLGPVAFHLLLIVDVLLLQDLDSVAAVGLYTVAVALLDQTRIPAEAISQVVLPRQAVGDLREAGEITAHAMRLNLVVSTAFIGTVAAVAPVLIPLVYGRSFTGSVAPLVILGPGMVALTLMRPVDQYLVRLERPMTLTALALVALAANVLLNLMLIPVHGAAGAALVSSLTYVALTIVKVAWLVRSAGLPVSALLPCRADLRDALGRVRVRPAGREVVPENILR